MRMNTTVKAESSILKHKTWNFDELEDRFLKLGCHYDD